MCSADPPALARDSVQSYVTKATRDPCRVGTIIPALKTMEARHRGGMGSWRKLRFDFSQSPLSFLPLL